MIFNKKKKALEKQLAELSLERQEQQQKERWQEIKIQAQEQKEWEWQEKERERLKQEKDQKDAWRRAQDLLDLEQAKKWEREQLQLERMRLTTPESLRGLRDLIRKRYELDMEIWSLKGARGPDRKIVTEKMEKSDALLLEIRNMVETWMENDSVWTGEEWRMAQSIKDRVFAEGKRWWENNPPWNEK